MLLIVAILAAWIAIALLCVAMCWAARRGDDQLEGSPTLAPPAGRRSRSIRSRPRPRVTPARYTDDLLLRPHAGE